MRPRRFGRHRRPYPEPIGLNHLLQVDSLLAVIPGVKVALTDCAVAGGADGWTVAATQTDTAVVQDYGAGGFAAYCNSAELSGCHVSGLVSVTASEDQGFAGGFVGISRTGGLADLANEDGNLQVGGSLISVNDLLGTVDIMVPNYTDCTVTYLDGGFVQADVAGGFAGELQSGKVNNQSRGEGDYFAVYNIDHVTGRTYAGGFGGIVRSGALADAGGGISILGGSGLTINLSELLNLVEAYVPFIQYAGVKAEQGFTVTAATLDPLDSASGSAGGFLGYASGAQISTCDVTNLKHTAVTAPSDLEAVEAPSYFDPEQSSYAVTGGRYAGGFVGCMDIGSAASVGDGLGVLESSIQLTNILDALSVVVTTIEHSDVSGGPGGYSILANANDSTGALGLAGGYVGHNMGGSIWGLNTDPWKTATEPYPGPTSVCKADRIRSVYGAEYAGGYTGFMEAADTASVGGLNVLNGLISVSNILGALSVVYPTQENTAVYGPLANLDYQTWNAWMEYVGQYGGYGYELAQTGAVSSQAELNAKLAGYIYGFHVVAGRSQKDVTLTNQGGDAGGYVGLMRSGALTNCMAYDVKLVRALRAAGGFAGGLETGGAAQLGEVSILGLDLNLGQLIHVEEVFVPAIRNASVYGYSSGLTVQAQGLPSDDMGYAGGFAGCSYGAQLQLTDDGLPAAGSWPVSAGHPAPIASCDVANLRRVAGRNGVGGYVGLASAASVASANTHASGGLLQGILDQVIASASNLVDLLPATVTTIHKASVSPADAAWGFVVEGAYTAGGATQYAPYAGGFAGLIQSAVLGEKDASGTSLTVEGLRSVEGGLYAGGFFGLADVAAVAEVAGGGSGGGTTDILGALVNLGSVDALDVLRCYIYNASVNGAAEGFVVQAHRENSEGIMDETRYTGCAGGFGGGLLGGTIRNSSVNGLSTVQGHNYTGGFMGHMGKSGVVDIDSLEALGKLLGATVGAIDLFGSQLYDNTMSGISAGAVVKAKGGQQPIAGGFVGYGDLGRIDNSSASNLKKVESDQVAGGFIGQTDMNYIVSAQVQSILLEAVLQIVNQLLEILYIGDLENLGLIDLDLWVLSIELLSDGNTLKVELLGLPITVALSKQADNPDQQTDVAIITIGDSEIRLPCSKQEGVKREDLENVEINLIKGNRTELEGCSVTGISNGYDVFGGGAGQDADGSGDLGIAGGFVGYNHEGKITDSQTVQCDTVRGAENKVGPFSGYNDLKSVYAFNTVQNIEGQNNTYSIYRPLEETLTGAALEDGTTLATASAEGGWNRYVVAHLAAYSAFADLENAVETGEGVQRELLVYISPAKAVLMRDANAPDNPPLTVPEPGEGADPCAQLVDWTIQKIWKDWNDWDKLRPETITITIYQQKFSADGTAQGEKTPYGEPITLTKADLESSWSATWRKVVEDLPVAEYQPDQEGNPTDTLLSYYVYSFEETTLPPGYEVEITADQQAFTVTIVNSHAPSLPDTGGRGDALFTAVGVGIILLAMAASLAGRKKKATPR